jgi:hypothetical protein
MIGDHQIGKEALQTGPLRFGSESGGAALVRENIAQQINARVETEHTM